MTGHSLGGALANLAALEIKKENPAVEVCCYTYGAPRVGNVAFASMCDAAFESWSVINDDDPVPRVPYFTYKRAGQQVIITTRGDCIVRPGYFELLLYKKRGKVADHQMGNYALAMAAIVRAQFFPHKALVGGAASAQELMKAVDVGGALLVTPFDPVEVANPAVGIKMRAMVSKIDGDALSAALSTAYEGGGLEMVEEGSEEWEECVESPVAAPTGEENV